MLPVIRLSDPNSNQGVCVRCRLNRFAEQFVGATSVRCHGDFVGVVPVGEVSDCKRDRCTAFLGHIKHAFDGQCAENVCT